VSDIWIGIFAIVASMGLVAMRVHIGAAFGIVAIIAFAYLLNWRAALSMASSVPFPLVGDWNMTAIPMFLLMGFIGSTTKLTESLFGSMRVLLSRLPGGLALTAVASCASLAAASGSSVATTAAMGRIAVPEMVRLGYRPSLAAGVVASSGTLGSLIPPSLLMIIYGTITEVSVGALFLAGVIPGILSALLYAAMVVVRVKLDPTLAPAVEERFTTKDRWKALGNALPLPLIILFVLGGILEGWFTPTEAGACATLAVMAVAAIHRQLTMAAFLKAARMTVIGTASLFMVVIGTAMLGRLMALTGLPGELADTITMIGLGPIGVIVLVAIIYIVLGMFLDSIGIMLLTLPILMPLTATLGIDMIWFGILVIKLLEIGLVTPPVGLNCFVLKGAVGRLISLPDIFRGVSWFIVTDLVALAILIAFPILSLWLPAFMSD
jgi:C4-dicarboxylate transporter DctM subunit